MSEPQGRTFVDVLREAGQLGGLAEQIPTPEELQKQRQVEAEKQILKKWEADKEAVSAVLNELVTELVTNGVLVDRHIPLKPANLGWVLAVIFRDRGYEATFDVNACMITVKPQTPVDRDDSSDHK